MKTKLTYILLLATLISFAQKPEFVRKGYYRVFVEGAEISKHSQEYKAYQSATDYLVSNPNIGIATIEFPEQIEVSIDWGDITVSTFQINSITQDKVTSTSIVIYFEVEGDVDYAQIKFREIGQKDWQETTKHNQNVIAPNPLKQDTEYEYIVYVVDSIGNKINSDIKTFKTL